MMDDQQERAEQYQQAVAVTTSWLRLFVGPEQVTELRALKVRQGNYRPVTVAGFYDHDHLGEMAKKALELTRQADGVYFTLNPINIALMGRRANRAATAEEGFSAADKDVLRKNWLLIDTDPVRPSGTSASDAEKVLALEAGLRVRDFLRQRGWPDPIRGDSGNGGHLLYRVQLPADDGGLLRRVLLALAAQFNSQAIKIDASVFNPARICKLYGTMAKKGDSIPERPHRRAQLLEVPGCAGPDDVASARLVPVPMDLLEAIAAEAPADPKSAGSPNGSAHTNGTGNGEYTHRLKVGEWLTARGVEYSIKELPGRTAYVLRHCPFNPDHTGKDVAIFQAPDGKLGAKCFHDSCGGNGWQEFKQKIGAPAGDHYDPPFEPKRRAGRLKVKAKGAAGTKAKATPKRVTPTNGAGPQNFAEASATLDRAIRAGALDDDAGGGTAGPAGANNEAAEAERTGYEIILDHFRRQYEPVFRRGMVMYSGTLCREVKMGEACSAPGITLAELLMSASNAPSGGSDINDMPAFFRNWAPSAWKDLLYTLPDEETAEEVIDTAEEDFWRKVAKAFDHHAVLGRTLDTQDGKVTKTERRTLLNWCQLFAKGASWQDIRGYRVWCRIDDAGRLAIALHQRLFGQVLGCAEMERLTPTKFGKLAELYMVGQRQKVKGTRAVVLSAAFLDHLQAVPVVEEDESMDGTETRAPAYEKEASNCPDSGQPPAAAGFTADDFDADSARDAKLAMESSRITPSD
jgi:hypothetical protein